MARKSGGIVPEFRGCIDANQAMAVLGALHFYHITKINSGERSGVEVAITHAGHRVSASRRHFVPAVNAAMEKLVAKDRPRMRLVGTFD